MRLHLNNTNANQRRMSLKPLVPRGNDRLVLSYLHFAIDNANDLSRLNFIPKEVVMEYRDAHRFPYEINADKDNFFFALVGYNRNYRMNFTQRVRNSDVHELIPKIFQKSQKGASALPLFRSLLLYP